MAEKIKCGVCGKEATVHLTQIVNNKIQKVDLCEDCAQEKGVTDPEGFSLADLLSKSPLTPAGAAETAKQCPVCGYRVADFRRTGRLGCPSCYDTFKDLIQPVLEDMHAGTNHVGKIPALALKRYATQMETKRLKEALAEAVKSENYELAAKFRDQIREIEAAVTAETPAG